MKNKLLKEVIQDTAKEFYKAGVMNEQIMREFDRMCLSTIKKHGAAQMGISHNLAMNHDDYLY